VTGPLRPIRPQRPIRPDRPIHPGGPIRPVPWTPFGPGDQATPDVQGILDQAAKTRASLDEARVKLTRMRHGPGPDGTPPVVADVSRADGLWPFLLIRSMPGDIGARPLPDADAQAISNGASSSPDIILTTPGPVNEPAVLGRDGIAGLDGRHAYVMEFGQSFDIWVHVWNLGRAPAHGVRVRAWLFPTGGFLGGRQLDLGDRTSTESHRVVKVGTYVAGAAGEGTMGQILATAECMSDVSNGNRDAGRDRHSAYRTVYIYIPS
jgi:hypothetical protein